MLKIPLLTKGDMDEALKLQKRQQFEDERKKRIFNAKQRLFGLDLAALERQIAEKKMQRQFEAECDKRWEEQTQKQQHAVYAKSLEMEKRQRVEQADINYYRCRFQRKDQRREFDLNDPNWIKKAHPMRSADDDLRLGISSAQVFNGEDLHYRERKRRQREQQRAWLDQQVRERKQAEEARAKADLIHQQSMISRDNCLEDMSHKKGKMMEHMTAAINNFNLELAKQKRAERERAKKEANEDDMAEIYNMLTSDMLTENPNVAESRTDPKKKIAFMYRGMTPEELAKFRDDQYRQMLANKKRNTEQQLMDKQWEQYALNIDRELILKELELGRRRQKEVDNQVKFNQQLAVKQKAQHETEDELMKRNYMSKDFYEQFNKTSR